MFGKHIFNASKLTECKIIGRHIVGAQSYWTYSTCIPALNDCVIQADVILCCCSTVTLLARKRKVYAVWKHSELGWEWFLNSTQVPEFKSVFWLLAKTKTVHDNDCGYWNKDVIR